MATTITNALLAGLRNHLVEMAAYGRYRIDSTWYRAEINTKDVKANGAVSVTFYVQKQGGGNAPADMFEICDAAGNALVQREEEVAFTEYMDEMLMRFNIGISAGQDAE